jgi:hypothetical protein
LQHSQVPKTLTSNIFLQFGKRDFLDAVRAASGKPAMQNIMSTLPYVSTAFLTIACTWVSSEMSTLHRDGLARRRRLISPAVASAPARLMSAPHTTAAALPLRREGSWPVPFRMLRP